MKNLAKTFLATLAILTSGNLHAQNSAKHTEVDHAADAAAASANEAAAEAEVLAAKKKSCDLEPIENCNEAGKMAIRGVGGVIDLKYAAFAFDKGCAANDYKACNNVAVLKQHGRGVKLDEVGARESYAYLCGKNEIQAACHNLAGMMLRGTGGEQSQLGLFIYRANCAADYPASCAMLKRFQAEQANADK